MNFRRPRRDDPEINLIPLVDVLLVILIFLLVSTSYARLGGLQVELPRIEGQTAALAARQIQVSVAADGGASIDGRQLGSADALRLALQQAAAGDAQTLVVIAADARSTQQAVVSVMQAARQAGLTQIAFLTQNGTTP